MRFRVLVAGVGLLALLGCSAQTQQQVQDTGRAVASDVKENAKEAVEVTKDAAEDAEITASVKAALVASNKMDTAALNVDTSGKIVYLRGHVPTVDQRTLAEEIAKNTVAAGTSVQNELSVGAPTATPSATGSGTPNPAASPGTITDDAHEGHDHSHEGHDHGTATPAATEDHTGHDHN